MTDYYFMTGDEMVRDALLDGPKDWHLNLNTYQAGQSGGLWNTRSVGGHLIAAARFSAFLSAIGDSDAAAVSPGDPHVQRASQTRTLCVRLSAGLHGGTGRRRAVAHARREPNTRRSLGLKRHERELVRPSPRVSGQQLVPALHPDTRLARVPERQGTSLVRLLGVPRSRRTALPSGI